VFAHLHYGAIAQHHDAFRCSHRCRSVRDDQRRTPVADPPTVSVSCTFSSVSTSRAEAALNLDRTPIGRSKPAYHHYPEIHLNLGYSLSLIPTIPDLTHFLLNHLSMLNTATTERV
jgi:hypothetical protein